MREVAVSIVVLLTTTLISAQTPPSRAVATPTYSEHVQPILAKHCEVCHRTARANIGGLTAPMPLTTYEEVRPWARAIVRAVQSRQMPPWLASPRTQGVFVNERARTFDRDTTILALWPHGHARTATAAYRAFYPDGRTEVLLEVPRYDYRWQETFRSKATPLTARRAGPAGPPSAVTRAVDCRDCQNRTG